MNKIAETIISSTGNVGSSDRTTTGNTTHETAQRIARWLEKQGHSIEPHEESDEEEWTDWDS
jgi:hypothetical protein